MLKLVHGVSMFSAGGNNNRPFSTYRSRVVDPGDLHFYYHILSRDLAPDTLLYKHSCSSPGGEQQCQSTEPLAPALLAYLYRQPSPASSVVWRYR